MWTTCSTRASRPPSGHGPSTTGGSPRGRPPGTRTSTTGWPASCPTSARTSANDDEFDGGTGDTADTDGETWDDQVGERRAGRLVAPDEGWVRDDDPEAWASDVGIDGAGASAEEAAVHVVDDDEV